MSIYAIGDIQGCYAALQLLLEKIAFDPSKDQLWFTGDIVNRGPDSLTTLRFIKKLVETQQAIMVLGNHDLHLIALAYGLQNTESEYLNDILRAPDKFELCDWLRQQPFLYHAQGYTLIHAGLPPQWDLVLAKHCANELEQTLQGENFKLYLENMYGNTPSQWSDTLSGWERSRFMTNCFTRLRFCDETGHLDLTSKGILGSQPPQFKPWFEITERQSKQLKIIFGHWAALYPHWHTLNIKNIYPLDSGCVWGNALTAMRLEDEKRFSVTCK